MALELVVSTRRLIWREESVFVFSCVMASKLNCQLLSAI